MTECNTVACDPTSGACVPTPDPSKDDTLCVLTGDVCTVDKTCQNGQCSGGQPKDCSSLDTQCEVGLCDTTSGLCTPKHAPTGSVCTDGISECQVGTCNVKGECKPSSAPDGGTCNDHNACTGSDTCVGGVCVGGRGGRRLRRPTTARASRPAPPTGL